MLRLVVDGGQHRLGRAAQQPEPGHAGPRADLDDGTRTGRGGEDGDLRADGGTDRRRAELHRVRTSTRDGVRLDDGFSDEACVGVVFAHDLILPSSL
jgi:hypothetical protein